MNPASADLAAERADFGRVIDTMRKFQAATLEDLANVDWVADCLREVGLVPIPGAEATYAREQEHLNGTQQGLIQLPREFARWLVLLGEQRPQSYLEIGCFNGGTISLTAAYLRRFAPKARVVSCDVFPAFIFYEQAAAVSPIEYAVGKTSFDFRGEAFEAVFIDGDHSFEWAWADYCNVGRAARICGLHDVNNAPYRELHLGGVCGAWEAIRQVEGEQSAHFIEIFEHPDADLMGIGVRIRR